MEKEIEMTGRERYRVIEADIIGINVAIDESVVQLTLYTDKRKTQTLILLDQEGLRQVVDQLNKIAGIKIDTRQVIEGYQ